MSDELTEAEVLAPYQIIGPPDDVKAVMPEYRWQQLVGDWLRLHAELKRRDAAMDELLKLADTDGILYWKPKVRDIIRRARETA